MKAKGQRVPTCCVLVAVCFLLLVNASTSEAQYVEDLERARDRVITGKANLQAGKELQDAGSNLAACVKYLEAAADYSDAAAILLQTDPPPNQQDAVLALVTRIQQTILEALDRAIECCEEGDPENCLSQEDYDIIVQTSDEVIQALDQLLGSIPTLTEWGLIIFGVVLLGFISWVFLRGRKAAVSLQ